MNGETLLKIAVSSGYVRNILKGRAGKSDTLAMAKSVLYHHPKSAKKALGLKPPKIKSQNWGSSEAEDFFMGGDKTLGGKMPEFRKLLKG